MTIQFLRLPTVQARTGLSKSELYRRMRAGTFPRTVPLGARAVAWRSDEVHDWMTRIQDARR